MYYEYNMILVTIPVVFQNWNLVVPPYLKKTLSYYPKITPDNNFINAMEIIALL